MRLKEHPDLVERFDKKDEEQEDIDLLRVSRGGVPVRV